MANVSIVAATHEPMDVIAFAAGVCYGKRDLSHKRVVACINNGHHSVLEHASATIFIDGISRACLAQLTRHRVASFCVESQRYCKVDTDTCWYVIPESIRHPKLNEPRFDMENEALDAFGDAMEAAAVYYKALLRDGVKPEDARAVLPNATKTNLVMTCNVRELDHIIRLRSGKTAQWEIRKLADDIDEACSGISDQWDELMFALREARHA